jgi:hypothetical protein
MGIFGKPPQVAAYRRRPHPTIHYTRLHLGLTVALLLALWPVGPWLCLEYLWPAIDAWIGRMQSAF